MGSFQSILLRFVGACRKAMLKVKALINVVNNEYNRLIVETNHSVSVKALQGVGIDIADDAIIKGVDVSIDVTRPSLVHIGSKTLLHHGFKLLTHDFATRVFLNAFDEFVPSSGAVWIGDNVWFGENVTVLKGAHIGNNCIIGINSIVMGNIPDNSVAAGIPARVICSLDDYFEKRKKKSVEEAFEYARSLQRRYNRRPKPEDFWEEFPLFVSGNTVKDYPEIPIRRQLGESYDTWCKQHVAPYATFDDFLAAAGL